LTSSSRRCASRRYATRRSLPTARSD
jgi:hypothetical protein